MRKPLQGIAFILFGMLLVLIAVFEPWLPILGSALQPILLLLGLAMGIAGLALSLSKDRSGK